MRHHETFHGYKHLNEKISEEQGSPIVLLHGIPSSLEEWNAYFNDLAAAGFKPCAVDLPGHGNSPKPVSREEYHEDAIYLELVRWINSLDMEGAFTLVGHSFGGHLAIRYVFENPGKVDRLVLINPFLNFEQINWINRLFYHNPAFPAAIYPFVPAFFIRLFVWLGSLQAGKFFQSSLSKMEFESMVCDYQRGSPQVVYIPRTVQDAEIIYSAIDIPVLLIWGKNDPTLSTASFDRIARLIPQCETFTVKGGHYPHRTNYGEVKTAIFDFLHAHSGSNRSE